MKKYLTINSLIAYREQLAWFLIWFTLPLSIWYNSLSIVLGGIVFMVSFFRKPIKFNKSKLTIYILPVTLLIISVFSVNNELFNIGLLKEIEQLLPLVAIPLLFLLSSINKKSFTQISLTGLVLSLTIAGIVMLLESLLEYTRTGLLSTFIYHNLSAPFNLGAVYFSFFLIVTLLQIDELEWISRIRFLNYIIIGFFLILLFLSASKLLLVTGIIVLILKYKHQIVRTIIRRKFLIPIAIILIALLIIPTGIRLKKISNPNIDLVTADSYKYDSPLNGLNLRLIQWRFGFEILNEKKAWFTGVGIKNSQKILNDKYIEYGIYTGYEGTSDTRYLNYNFHNQFVEQLLRTGVVGLLILIMMFITILVIPGSVRFVSNWIILVFFMFFLTESVLERQQGIVYFCLIYSSYFPLSKKQIQK